MRGCHLSQQSWRHSTQYSLQFRSNTSTSASAPGDRDRRARREIAAPSPALQRLAVDVDLAARDLHPGVAAGLRARASTRRAVEQRRSRGARPGGWSRSRRGRRGEATSRRRVAPLVVLESSSARSSARCRAAAGRIQICRKCTGSSSDGLNSLCVTPVPALMRCTSPGRITEPVPMESLCASAPSSTYEMISMSRCGCVPKPPPPARRGLR